MFKIALSAGHYKYTAGKRCDKKLDPNQTREWVLNDRICDKIENLLKNYEGYELLRLDDTTGEKGISLSQRSSASNKFGADFYLAIHHNAGVKGGSGGGIVAFIYNGKVSAATVEWQKELYDALIKKTGLKGNRAVPLAKDNLHECREPKAPAVLLELGFMDSKTDVPIILTDKYAQQCAEAIVEVIVKRGKLTKKKTTATTPAATKNNKVIEWQKAAIADGFKFPKYGADGDWGSECISVATKAICKKQLIGYKNKNLTKIVQKAVGVEADGKFGNNTKKAVIEYQKKNGLTADGIVGYNTWKKILGV